MEGKTEELKTTLTGQNFETVDKLNEARTQAYSFAKVTEGIAVLSDFSSGNCHTFSGKFG